VKPFRLSGTQTNKLFPIGSMNALSRREEESLLKTTKARAVKACDPVVKGQFHIPSELPLIS
jgi:hypothetical protein